VDIVPPPHKIRPMGSRHDICRTISNVLASLTMTTEPFHPMQNSYRSRKSKPCHNDIRARLSVGSGIA
jgi:hypothetical protein